MLISKHFIADYIEIVLNCKFTILSYLVGMQADTVDGSIDLE